VGLKEGFNSYCIKRTHCNLFKKDHQIVNEPDYWSGREIIRIFITLRKIRIGRICLFAGRFDDVCNPVL
jgi:hypothetical protein